MSFQPVTLTDAIAEVTCCQASNLLTRSSSFAVIIIIIFIFFAISHHLTHVADATCFDVFVRYSFASPHIRIKGASLVELNDDVAKISPIEIKSGLVVWQIWRSKQCKQSKQFMTRMPIAIGHIPNWTTCFKNNTKNKLWLVLLLHAPTCLSSRAEVKRNNNKKCQLYELLLHFINAPMPLTIQLSLNNSLVGSIMERCHRDSWIFLTFHKQFVSF